MLKTLLIVISLSKKMELYWTRRELKNLLKSGGFLKKTTKITRVIIRRAGAPIAYKTFLIPKEHLLTLISIMTNLNKMKILEEIRSLIIQISRRTESHPQTMILVHLKMNNKLSCKINNFLGLKIMNYAKNNPLRLRSSLMSMKVNPTMI